MIRLTSFEIVNSIMLLSPYYEVIYMFLLRVNAGIFNVCIL